MIIATYPGVVYGGRLCTVIITDGSGLGYGYPIPLTTGEPMDLHTRYPYWLLKSGFENSYPLLDTDIKTDVAVVGAGITGALTAFALAEAGLDVIVLEKRHPGMGSTSASTALLQYEIDEPLHRLIDLCGRKRAEDSYRACYQAIDTLAALVTRKGLDAEFEKVPSLQYASYKKDVDSLKREYTARKRLGFAVSLLGPDEIKTAYGFTAPAALLSEQAGQVDAYRLAHGLLASDLENLRVYDCSELTTLEEHRRGLTLRLKNGVTVKAAKAVLACGYESLKYLDFHVASIGTTYALATKPLSDPLPWKERTLIWETKDPYLYLRTTADNRVMAGGRDDEAHNPFKADRALPRKVKGLLSDLEALLPGVAIYPDFTWAGAFASTRDSLGYIGPVPSRPHVYANLGFGGNGILYSQIGAEVIRAAIEGEKHPYANTFAFGR